jgi:hypothetical protein
MSRTTPRRPTPPPSPRYTKRHGIGRDRMRWPAAGGTFRWADWARSTATETSATPGAGKYEEGQADGDDR